MFVGPLRFPILGSYFWLLLKNWNFPQYPIQEWAKKYGPFFGMYVGDYPCLMTCDYDTCKEVLNRLEFDGKPKLYAAQLRALDKELGKKFVSRPVYFSFI